MNAQRISSWVALCLAASFSFAASAADGTVQSAEAAWISVGDSSVIARRGSVISPGSSVKTVTDGFAQWQMSDGGAGALAPDSAMTVENYRYPQEDGRSYGKGMVKLRLNAGSARVLTGSVAHNNPKGFVMTTPNGTISEPDAAGTDYTVTFCDTSCPERDGETLPAGLWVAVNDGALTVSNSPGVRASSGQFIHVPIGGHPQLVDTAPNVLLSMQISWNLVDFTSPADRLGYQDSLRIEPAQSASPSAP